MILLSALSTFAASNVPPPTFAQLASNIVARSQWERTQENWRDSLAIRFENEHWIPISGENEAALRALEELAEEIEAIELALANLQ